MTRLTRRSTAALERLRDHNPALAGEITAIIARRASPRPKRRGIPIIRHRAAAPCLTWRPVIDAVCRRHRLTLKDVLTTSRLPHLVACRYEIWWTIRQEFGSSLPDIGRRLGGFDHSTVHHGLRVFARSQVCVSA